MALIRAFSNLVAFPRADLRHALGAALVRDAANFADVSVDGALALALANRLAPAPIDFEKARGILLVGPTGSGKSAVAVKIVRSASLIGRKTELTRADGGLALFRTNSNPPELLTVME